jgi:hypothetical protein
MKDMAAATDYLRSVDERTNWNCIKSTVDIFFFWYIFLSTKSMPSVSFIYYKNRNLKNHKIYFNKLLVLLCELRNHFILHHFLNDIGLLFSVNDEKNVYKKIVNYSLWFGFLITYPREVEYRKKNIKRTPIIYIFMISTRFFSTRKCSLMRTTDWLK